MNEKLAMAILAEHAEFLTALVEIDTLLEKFSYYVLDDERHQALLTQMRTAMPESIKETRKGGG